MPFCTREGGLAIYHDISQGVSWRAAELKVSPQELNDMNPNSRIFKLVVRRGAISQEHGCWIDSPVFRIPHELFSPRQMQRIVSAYELHQNYLTHKQLHYEPDIDDIIESKYGFDETENIVERRIQPLPLWVLNILDKRGDFDRAVNEGLVGALPHELGRKRLTETGLKAIKAALEDRRQQELEDIKSGKIDERKLGLMKAIVEELEQEREKYRKMFGDIRTFLEEENVEPAVMDNETMRVLFGINTVDEVKERVKTSNTKVNSDEIETKEKVKTIG